MLASPSRYRVFVEERNRLTLLPLACAPLTPPSSTEKKQSCIAVIMLCILTQCISGSKQIVSKTHNHNKCSKCLPPTLKNNVLKLRVLLFVQQQWNITHQSSDRKGELQKPLSDQHCFNTYFLSTEVPIQMESSFISEICVLGQEHHHTLHTKTSYKNVFFSHNRLLQLLERVLFLYGLE
jgi:hypothetical protein